MRTAYKVWSGIAAGVFCLVAIGDLSDGGTSTTAAPAAVNAPAAPTYVAPVAEPMVREVPESYPRAQLYDADVLSVPACRSRIPRVVFTDRVGMFHTIR